MKRKFESLRENLDEFVEQNEFPMLVVGCLSDELAYVVKFLQALEEKHPQNYFIIFPQPFYTAESYLDQIVLSLHQQVTAAATLREQRGEPAFPPVPTELADQKRPAEQRLRGVLDYLRGLLPNEEEHRVVVGLLPLQCADFPSYVRLVSWIMPIPSVQPWMVPLRIVTYDDRSQKLMTQALRAHKAEHVLTFEVDFSTPALTNALTEDASNPSLPLAERMSCLMQLAALDYSYKRYPDALQKYGVLYKYYEEQNIPSMQALAMLGASDTLRAGNQPLLAKELLQRCIALCMQHKQLGVLLNSLISIVETCFDLAHFPDAESYAESGSQVAAGVLNPYAYADTLERKGDAQYAQRKLPEAMATYKRCQELCQTYEYFYRWKSVLNKQIEWYRQAMMDRERAQTEHELGLVEELERRGGKAGIQQSNAALQGAAQ